MGPERPVAAVAQEGIGGAAIETSSSVNSTTIARERPRTQKEILCEAPERTEARSLDLLCRCSLFDVTQLCEAHNLRCLALVQSSCSAWLWA